MPLSLRASPKHGSLATFAGVLVVASIGLLDEAHADEPVLARPPTLPELTHRYFEITHESTLAALQIADSSTALSRTVRVERLALEVPIVAQRWYAGAGYDALVTHTPNGAIRVVGGNPEILGRGAWSASYGLSFGGGLALVAPLTSFEGTESRGLAAEAIAARGWERALWDPSSFTFRPFLDVRDVTGIFTLQYRQALEIALDVRDVGTYRFSAIGTLYVGVALSPRVTVGAELIEYYRLDAGLDDVSRAYFAVGANVRITTRYFQPTIGLMTNIGSPLNAIARIGAPLDSAPESFIGLRLGLTFVTATASKDAD
ncbi:hypothetical protein BH09MYX1_BH09MYX1_46420 [soil metagenome]